ncbi:MAG: hypothetical protein EOQ57_35760, partial [Mesorhizobium sp.]|uniref:FG-GAP-like repeat-containing protein n=2 Tax=Mesorhizobium sp. TaxID=1871066 RepID=UPI000FE7E982
DANATDADNLGALTYALSGTDAALFNINATTGEVTFKAAPNFEAPADADANNVYDLVVTASDGTLGTDRSVAITVTNVNDNAPGLTNLEPSLTVLENAANSSPQIIDADVTFQDPENNVAGGLLTVSGLLAEDRISIQNAGNGEDQIGFDSISGVVSYGGLAIGTTSGGNGTTLTVSLNASATSVAVERLIEALTYQDVSNTPTESRTLKIVVTDADGASTYDQAHPAFALQTGATDPFSGLDVGDASRPAFADLDGDGDLDAIVGAQYGGLRYFLNTGTTTAPVYAQQFGADNPVDGVNPSSPGWLTPVFADLNGDGRSDLVLGENDGHIFYFQNMGTAAAPAFVQQAGAANPFDGVDVGGLSAPTFGDLDGDGDLDAVIGAEGGGLHYFQNTGSVLAPIFIEQVGAANPFNGIQVGTGDSPGSIARTTPSLVDIDGDGDLDVVVGTAASGTLQFLLNNGSTFTPEFSQQTSASNPFSTFNLGFDLRPTVADINADGRPDVVVGISDGTLRLLQNTTSVGVPITVHVTAENDAPDLTPNTPPPVVYTGGAVGLLPTAHITDPDSPANFAGGQITVSLSGGDPGDRFSIMNNLPTGNVQVGYVNGVLHFTVDGVDVGTVSGLGSTNMSFALNGNATTAAVDGLLKSLILDNFYQTITDAPRTATITFSDGGNTGSGGALTDSVSIEISPIATNHPPSIVSNGGGDDASIDLAENTTAVTTVTATDPDAGDTLTYSIVGGFDANLFAIDSQSGALSFVTAPDFENPNLNGGIFDQFYQVVVQADDGHGGLDTQTITVTVTNVNDNAPVFSSGTTANFAENGTGVAYDANATDADN